MKSSSGLYGEHHNATKKLKEILESLYKDGKVESNEYIELKQKLDDIEEISLPSIDAYKKAFSDGRVDKCVNALFSIYEDNQNNFRKAFLMSDCLKNPLGYKFDEKTYKLTALILINAINFTKKNNYPQEFLNTLGQFLLYTELFYNNNVNNTGKLTVNEFNNFSLSKQLRMISIFIQDQARLLRSKVNTENQSKEYVTGMDLLISNQKVDYTDDEHSSMIDNYEGKIEFLDILVKYLYYSKRDQIKWDSIEDHGDIHHFELPCFEEVCYLAHQRNILIGLETAFRHDMRDIILTNDINHNEVFYFPMRNYLRHLTHFTAGVRRSYRLSTVLLSNLSSNSDLESKSIKTAIDNMIDLVNINDIDTLKINKKDYSTGVKRIQIMTDSYKKLINPFYLTKNIAKVKVVDIIQVYEFLRVLAEIYIAAVYKVFDENSHSSYKYLAPIIKLSTITANLCELLGYTEKYADRIISFFIIDDTIKNADGDLFSRPLIRVNNSSVVLCENLIEQMNLDRSIEMLFSLHKVDLSPMGHAFEEKLVTAMARAQNISVNTTKIKFLAYAGKDVEFDFLATFDNYLLIIEFKALTVPYEKKQLHYRFDEITYGVEQVLRRCDIVEKDWNIIKNTANIALPESPYSKNQIIKVVCTNIFDFTTLCISGVLITDESTLLKYFTDPYVGKSVLDNDSRKDEYTRIWKDVRPSIPEFIDYLKHPSSCQYIHNCIVKEQRLLPRFAGDKGVGFEVVSLDADPVRDIVSGKKLKKEQKVKPNEKCPCGSGKKYKKCCRVN